jgi:excisionase family DNA binding protein
MKIELEQQDIEAVAQKVSELLKPLLAGNSRNEDKDTVLTPETLADYLQVDISWVYKQVSLKTIPSFKSGKYTRFKKSVIDKWIETQTVRPIPSLKMLKKAG